MDGSARWWPSPGPHGQHCVWTAQGRRPRLPCTRQVSTVHLFSSSYIPSTLAGCGGLSGPRAAVADALPQPCRRAWVRKEQQPAPSLRDRRQAELRFSLRLRRPGKVRKRTSSRALNESTAKRKKSVFPSALPDTYNRVTFSSIGFSRSLALSLRLPAWQNDHCFFYSSFNLKKKKVAKSGSKLIYPRQNLTRKIKVAP